MLDAADESWPKSLFIARKFHILKAGQQAPEYNEIIREAASRVSGQPRDTHPEIP